MTYATGGIIQASDFNTLSANLKEQWGQGTGNHGLGQDSTGWNSVTAGSIVNASEWTNMFTAVNKGLAHEGQSTITPTGVSNANLITFFNSLVTGTTTFYNNSGTTGISLSDSAPTTTTYSGTWGATGSRGVYFTQTVTFASGDAARYFFNAGGNIKLTFSKSAANSTRNAEWSQLASDCGTVTYGWNNTTKVGGSGATPSIILNANNGGFWNTSDTHHFKQFDNVGAYSNNYIDVEVAWSGTAGTGGGYSTLTFVTTWKNDYVNAFQDEVTGTTSTSLVVSSPATTYLTNTWGAPAPSVSGSTSLTYIVPPTAASGTADPYFSNIVLLLHGDSSSGTTIKDSSTLNHALYNFGGYIVSDTLDTKIGSYALKFGPINDYWNGRYMYASAGISDFEFPGDFTIETFIKPLSFGSTWGSYIACTGSSSNNAGGWILAYGYNGSGFGNKFFFNVGSTTIKSNATPTTGAWQHVAVVRSGTTISMFIDGIKQTETATLSGTVPALSFQIGRAANGGGDTGISGSLDEFAITKGVARYISNFSVPTIAYSATVPDPYYANVSLLLHFDGANASTNILDKSPTPKTMIANGAAQLTTSNYKYGTAGLAVLASGNTVETATNVDFNLPGDFTFEAWINLNSLTTSSYATIFNIGNFATGLFVRVRDHTLDVWIANNDYTAPLTLHFVPGNWYHIAVCRQGSNLYRFVNGTMHGGVADVGVTNIPQSSVLIGQSAHNASEFFDGYIDDLRLTKGIARYTANFTPPTTAFPNN